MYDPCKLKCYFKYQRQRPKKIKSEQALERCDAMLVTHAL